VVFADPKRMAHATKHSAHTDENEEAILVEVEKALSGRAELIKEANEAVHVRHEDFVEFATGFK